MNKNIKWMNKNIKWMNKNNNRNMILMFLVVITIISVAFGYIYGREMNNVTMIDVNEFEGFGQFTRTIKPSLDAGLKVEFNFKAEPKFDDPNLKKNKNIDKIKADTVLNDVSWEVPLYQIRFPKNSINFKPIYMKIEFTGLDIASLSKQGEISVSLYEHKETKTIDELSYPTFDVNGGYKRDIEKTDPDMITMKNAFIRKKIYSQTFCEFNDSSKCGTNTNLKGDTYVIELNKDELPNNTVIGDKHVIMIGGNSSIKYKTVNISIVGDYEDVEQLVKLEDKDLRLFANKGSWESGLIGNSVVQIKPELLMFQTSKDIGVFIKQIRYKPGISSMKIRNKGNCVNVTHKIIFNAPDYLGETQVKLYHGDNSIENKAENVWNKTCGGAIRDRLQPIKVVNINKPLSIVSSGIFINTVFSSNKDVRSMSHPVLFELSYTQYLKKRNKNI